MSKQFLSFRLGEQHYAVDITAVQEIRRAERITAVAGSPRYVLGIVELRGRILPIMDLGARFQIGSTAHPTDPSNRAQGAIVVLNEIDGISFGIAVGGVDGVLRIEQAAIQPLPAFDGVVDERMFTGVVPDGEHLTLLLDVNALAGATQALAAQAA